MRLMKDWHENDMSVNQNIQAGMRAWVERQAASKLGSLLASIGRDAGLTDQDVEALQ